MFLFFLLLAIAGHALFCIGSMNRIHARHMPRWLMRLGTDLFFLWLVSGAAGALVWWWIDAKTFAGIVYSPQWSEGWPLLLTLYFGFCTIVACVGITRFVWLEIVHRRLSPLVRSRHTMSIPLSLDAAAQDDSEKVHHPCVRLPGNESLELERTDWEIAMPRFPAALDGLKIVHLSDLHFTGRIGKAYFREVVRAANECKPDIIAITGDIVDRQCCISWVPDTLGELNARYGVFFILGNHDLQVNTTKSRRTLVESGLIDLGGRWMQLHIGDSKIVLAGNELPWHGPAAEMDYAPIHTFDGSNFRILLAHTPDQLGWARHFDVDLMLCGHTHGGQIRFPPLGAIFSPSKTGVKYDYGFFHKSPTSMHVSRGVSGQEPLRWNCPPEISLLILHPEQ